MSWDAVYPVSLINSYGPARQMKISHCKMVFLYDSIYDRKKYICAYLQRHKEERIMHKKYKTLVISG